MGKSSGLGRVQPSGLFTCLVDAGCSAKCASGRIGRGLKPPPQLGQTPLSSCYTQSRQKVHSKEQIIALGELGGNSTAQHSQLGLISSIVDLLDFQRPSSTRFLRGRIDERIALCPMRILAGKPRCRKQSALRRANPVKNYWRSYSSSELLPAYPSASSSLRSSALIGACSVVFPMLLQSNMR